jgi:AcrR family transcriptional regulator
LETGQRDIILVKAMELYMEYGLRSVSMDQIAGELGISKKTIYRYFSSKSELVHEGIQMMAKEVHSFVNDIAARQNSPIDELFAIDKAMRNYFTPTHERIIYQLKKYYPKTFRYIQEIKKEEMVRVTTENLQQGIKTGYYRTDFDPEIIAHLYLGQAYMMMNDDFFWKPKLDQKVVHRQALLYHLHGIVSDKGRKHLIKKYNS